MPPATAVDRYRVRKWDEHGRLVEDQVYSGHYKVTYDQPRVEVETLSHAARDRLP